MCHWRRDGRLIEAELEAIFVIVVLGVIVVRVGVVVLVVEVGLVVIVLRSDGYEYQ